MSRPPLDRGALPTYRRLLGYLAPHRGRFVLGMLGGALFAATMTSFAWFAKKFGDGTLVHELERFLNTLGTIAGVSPLLGLLGTVTGIIRAFNAIEAGGMGDPRALSGGIAEALIATAAGLCVAIPALISYRYLRGRVDGIVVEMEKNAIRMADALEAARSRERTAPPAAVAVA